MFAKPDLVLLHAPSVYDFRKLPILFGPISDLVPSTPIFEMYPVGFSSIAEHLERNGIRVRIINLAFRMLRERDFDAEKLIAKLKPQMFGIDLHWLPHAHGSLEVAALCKKHHPHIPVVFGGYSASYFHEELIRYPQVDYVIRGDSAEEPLRRLMVALKERQSLAAIPNLTWKDEKKDVHVNPLTHVLPDLDEYSNNYLNLFRSVVRYLDLKSLIPIHDWWEYPITAVMTVRGCTHNCVFCGGSNFGLSHFYCRDKPAPTAARKKWPTTSWPSPGTRMPLSLWSGTYGRAGRNMPGGFSPGSSRCGRKIKWSWNYLIPRRNPISRWWRRPFPTSILRLPPSPMTRKSAGQRENSIPMKRWKNRSAAPWITAARSSMSFS